MASEIKVDTISEKTSANGVTIDSLSIKDGGLIAEGNIDVNGNNLVLDANANTYLDAGTDDTIKVYVSGAEDLRIAANAINVLSGTTLTIDSGATITNSGTANGFGALAGIDDQTSSNDDQLTITDSAVIINEDSDDLDFRVESNGNANMLFVDGGSNLVGVGGDPDLGTGLHIRLSDTGASASNNAPQLVIEHGTSNEQCGISILSRNDMLGNIFFGDDGDDDIGAVRYNHSGNILSFVANAAERMRIQSDGAVLIGKTSATDTVEGIKLAEAGTIPVFTNADNVVLALNRQDDDGIILQFRQSDGAEGTVSVSGATIAYNTFCGTHWSRLADNSKPIILRGTVMESIATMCNWYQAVADVAESTDSTGNVTPAHQVKESINLPNGKSAGDAVTFTSSTDGKEYTGVYVKEDNEQLPMCKISDTADSKAVYGVFMCWDDRDDGLDGDVNDMNVAALGAFVVRIHKDETVAIGDYLQSKGDGTAKKQADDILRASTIAKVTSTEKTHIHADGSYCVPCTLHCG